MTELERAQKALDKAISLLHGHAHLFPATDRCQLADSYERVRSFLASLGPEEPGPQLLTVLAHSQHGQALVWEALIALEDRLMALENQLAEQHRDYSNQLAEQSLRQMALEKQVVELYCDYGNQLAGLSLRQMALEKQVVELYCDYSNQLAGLSLRQMALEKQVAELQGDHRKLLLRQMASQTENKVARFTTSGLTPKLAVHMSFNRLSKGGGQQFNQAVFQLVVKQYPGLQAGLEALKELGTVIMHPEKVHLIDGSRQLVTSEVLKDLIDNEYPDGDPVKSDVEAVHTCLTDVACKLNEDIFVLTM